MELKAKTYREESIFFYKIIKKKIKKTSKILDAGAGPGFLVNHLILKGYKNVIGLDKLSSGFKENKNIQKKYLKNIKVNKNFFFTTIEKIKTRKKFDFIFLFSVIEHVRDWKKLIRSCLKRLDKNGKIIINFPNYSTFYEPHFGLPIIINKKITFFIYKKYILNFEKKNNYKGMFKDLNFLKYKELAIFLDNNKFKYNVDKQILKNYLMRIKTDKQFKRRHPFLSPFIYILNSINKFELFKYIPINFQPIIQVEIKKIN